MKKFTNNPCISGIICVLALWCVLKAFQVGIPIMFTGLITVVGAIGLIALNWSRIIEYRDARRFGKLYPDILEEHIRCLEYENAKLKSQLKDR